MKLEMLLLKSLFAAIMGLSTLLFVSMLTARPDPVRVTQTTSANRPGTDVRSDATMPTCPLPPDQVTCFRAG